MAKQCSKAVEVLPGSTVDWVVGSLKNSTARVCQNGRNILMPKLRQPNKTGGNPNMFKGAGEKWRSMTAVQKQPWVEIADEKWFRSAWNAFNSSFFRSVAMYGLDYTMSHELEYIDSDHRAKREEYLHNSLKRLADYEVKEEFYTETDDIFELYPVALTSPHIRIRLRDLNDVNNALAMKWLYRTDDFLEYHFDPVEQDQYTEKGSYTLTKRPRQELELYQLIRDE